jgi:hypothetical protein
MAIPQELRIPLATLLASAMVLAGCTSRAEAPPLPPLQIDSQRVAVTGLSSGAYMATQVHVALSDRLRGAALIAGGPYGCAAGDLGQALGVCMKAEPAAPDATQLAERARARASEGRIAALSGLSGDRVLVLHGAQDLKVAPAVGAAAADFYRALQSEAPGLQVQARLDGAFGHLMPLPGEGDECADPPAPYLGRCGVDAAALVFETLYGPAPREATSATGKVQSFSQQALIGDGPDPVLAETGYVYVPAQCEGETCGLLLAFHGCLQNADKVGEAFVREGGFNRWADAYGVVVLYPQTRASYAPLNPNACWDWWGYTGEHYDTRDGAQLRWVARVLEALGV